MKTSLMAGVALLAIGISTAFMGLLNVGGQSPGADSSTSVQYPIGGPLWDVGLPIIAGLSLALGALLIGLNMGNWRHPRSHPKPGDEVVDPEGHHKMKHV